MLGIIEVWTGKNVELAAYDLKCVSQGWFNHWKEKRAINTDPVDWEKFKGDFLDHFLPLEMWEAKALEFINLKLVWV